MSQEFGVTADVEIIKPVLNAGSDFFQDSRLFPEIEEIFHADALPWASGSVSLARKVQGEKSEVMRGRYPAMTSLRLISYGRIRILGYMPLLAPNWNGWMVFSESL